MMTPFFKRSMECIQCCAASAFSASVEPFVSMSTRVGCSVYMKMSFGGLDGSAMNIQEPPQNAEIVRQMMQCKREGEKRPICDRQTRRACAEDQSREVVEGP